MGARVRFSSIENIEYSVCLWFPSYKVSLEDATSIEDKRKICDDGSRRGDPKNQSMSR